MRLKLIGIGDKYIQQDEADQELAFQKAFTLDALTTTAHDDLVGVPCCRLIAIIHGQWDLRRTR